MTDIDLTPDGVAQVSSAAATLVGASKLVDPSRLVHVFVSPRTRAVKTLEILLSADASSGAERPSYSVTVTEDLAEWNYGDYEGHYADEIRALRSKRGLDVARAWDIWTDGCEGGECVWLFQASPRGCLHVSICDSLLSNWLFFSDLAKRSRRASTG